MMLSSTRMPALWHSRMKAAPLSAVPNVQGVPLGAGRLVWTGTGANGRIVNEGTTCEGSVLDIDHVPGELTCDECGARTTMEEMRIMCGACGSSRVTVTGGEELLVTSIELAEAG